MSQPLCSFLASPPAIVPTPTTPQLELKKQTECQDKTKLQDPAKRQHHTNVGTKSIVNTTTPTITDKRQQHALSHRQPTPPRTP